jgi:hypothetical protein
MIFKDLLTIAGNDAFKIFWVDKFESFIQYTLNTCPVLWASFLLTERDPAKLLEDAWLLSYNPYCVQRRRNNAYLPSLDSWRTLLDTKKGEDKL